jgi:uncharacterized protein YPO0396
MNLQATIFDKDKGNGFRLQYFQVYNWGTFGENQVWKLEPKGETSLLTGANGSGKTTLVDALLTLLVPGRLRFYNQSSGTETRRDRTEASYVLGAFGQSQEAGRISAKTDFLREKKGTYSVLLACFFNPNLDRYLSLGQIRWFMSGGKLNQEYFSAPSALDIVKHDLRYDPGTQWKERLRKLHQLQFYPSFSGFQADFIRKLGMRSEKALNLFNQTVGIKVLGKLDEFIRDNMLEPGDPEEDFRKLEESFETLLSSYRAFEKARMQLKLLEPIVRENQSFEALLNQREQIEKEREFLPVWFAHRENQLLHHALLVGDRELKQVAEKLGSIGESLEAERESESKLRADIASNEIGRQISSLERSIREHEEKVRLRREELKKYNLLARKTGLRTDPTEKDFVFNQGEIQRELDRVYHEKRALEEQKIKFSIDLRDRQERKGDLEEEFQSLQKRRNQIPRSSIRIREGILAATGATEKEIPFIGELLKVKEEEAAVWENAIERMLHNFALRLLVPEKFYAAVNRYVNQTNLNGRIVYHRVDSREAPDIFRTTEAYALYAKLEIHPDTVYDAWLIKELRRRFDHRCTTDLKVFRLCEKALTPQGLSKNKLQHEKDDRAHRLGAENYVLGWDNQEKLRLIRDRIRSLVQEVERIEAALRTIEQKTQSLEGTYDDLKELSRFVSFEAMHWQSLSVVLDRQQKELAQLRQSSNQLAEMKRRLEQIQLRIQKQEEKRVQTLTRKTRLEDRISNHKSNLELTRQLLEPYSHLDLEAQFVLLADRTLAFASGLDLRNLEKHRRQEVSRLESDLNQLTSKLAKSENRLYRVINDFRSPSPEIQNKFRDWTGETREMGSGVEYVQSYLDLFEQIKNEKILDYEKRFREYLDEKMIGDMASFQTSLENRLEGIEDTIQDLNQSLRAIDFRKNPRTYIQLVFRSNGNEQIRDFRQRLRSDWKFDTGEYERTRNATLLKRSFDRIRAIIETLRESESYRRRVLDVRNWLIFSATEHIQENGEQFNVYESTGHLSGGEKAQITYTILGAALAYQFGIDQAGKQAKSFRFIMVDEAFSKLDPEKSKYLMELCEQLHLQLLVVTPLDKIHVAEPYIHAVHYVENKDKRHSRVHNLSLSQYRERKEEFQTMEAAES